MKIFGGNHGRKPSAVHDETAPLPQVDTQEEKAGAPSRDNVGKGEEALPGASVPEKQPEGAAKGQGKSKETAAQPDQPQKDPGKPGQGQESRLQSGKKKKKRLKARYIPLIVLGVLLVLGVGVYAFLKAFAKPPDVSVKEPEITLGEGEEDPYADLVEPFIEDGDRERKDDYYTFMFCGTDDGGTRTDTIIVASYNVKTQEVNMVNIPRDTMSNVKRSIKKINGGFNGGPEQLEKELEMLLGIPIDRYVVVSFEGFEELIDLIGGVDFNVPTYMVWDDPSQDLHIYLEPGMQHLDGEKAIQLVRFRQNNPGVKGGYAEGDIGRIKMQQEFLRTVAKKILSPQNLLNLGDMTKAVLDNTETNLTLSELTWFGMQALKMDFNNINMTTLPGHAAYLYEADYGHMQSYFVPEEENILEMVNELLNPYTEDVTKLNLIDISRYSTSAPANSGSSSSSSSEGEDDEPPAQNSGSSSSSGSSSGSGSSSSSGNKPDDGGSTTQPGGETNTPTEPEGGGNETVTPEPEPEPTPEPEPEPTPEPEPEPTPEPITPETGNTDPGIQQPTTP